ncbi:MULTISPECIES: NAD(P)-dependent oxidoreductase [unclassified Nodularia (in: cyanobacteria)]|uniref:NAD-dependent epimerase/dehydratase family protein n=1 Tax=unclassified Nodularia (in: cyanobacteria) TaxID=2656917 RepID=UPI00187E722A|nr:MULTISPECIES: NAD(P)-dependent oxidoreductase [unclassified Nodularia (in: cyanobacteria)]MBE9201577.1 NAD(P)-dependent oxidoreductase [Nodularia sp. LEGE 06071]MCC2694470.1 NAD(P)-dependent oxidoreductase [Nodularia sp. LEGE 04288]
MFDFLRTRESTTKKLILLTGAAGNIGTSLQHELNGDYQFRCIDRRHVPQAKDFRRVDITNFKAVLKVMGGVDAVIHLAANPNVDQPWQDVYSSGIGGTYNIFEAARQSGIKKIIYASTNYVSGWREVEQESHITPEQLVRPDSLYAVGKAFGEALGQYFSDRYGMSVICLRIGWFHTEPKIYAPNDRILSNWCSSRDLAQIVRRSLEHDNLGFQIFYAVSGNTRRYWDISNAQKLLGYEPEDNAEIYFRSFLS